jgi:hypothetical protein
MITEVSYFLVFGSSEGVNNRVASVFARRMLAQLGPTAPAALKEAVIPKDAVGCKRILFSSECVAFKRGRLSS